MSACVCAWVCVHGYVRAVCMRVYACVRVRVCVVRVLSRNQCCEKGTDPSSYYWNLLSVDTVAYWQRTR